MPIATLSKEDMIKTVVVAAIICVTSSAGCAAEIVAKAETGAWTISVIAEGGEWDPSCTLKLVAETDKIKREMSLKRESVSCALFGLGHLYAGQGPDRGSMIVFFEAARGGDGDHSGPIVEIFKLTKQGLQKLGEHELLDATYHRKNEQITSVTGTVVFSLCYACDGPDGTDLYIPAQVTIGPAWSSILIR